MSALLPLLKIWGSFAHLSISGYEFDLILKFRILVSGLHIIGADSFSSPGLCPWRAYVVTQALASASASASALAQCLSFQMCA